MPIGHSRFSFGVGFLPDLMSVGDWRYVDAPGVAGATYGLQEQKSAIRGTADRRLASAITMSSRLSIGATLGANYNQNTLDAPYIFQSQPVLAGLKTMLDLHTDGVGWNGSVGVLARPSNKVQVGAAWKSRTVIDSTGTRRAMFRAICGAGRERAFRSSRTVAKVQNVLAAIGAGQRVVAGDAPVDVRLPDGLDQLGQRVCQPSGDADERDECDD